MFFDFNGLLWFKCPQRTSPGNFGKGGGWDYLCYFWRWIHVCMLAFSTVSGMVMVKVKTVQAYVDNLALLVSVFLFLSYSFFLCWVFLPSFMWCLGIHSFMCENISKMIDWFVWHLYLWCDCGNILTVTHLMYVSMIGEHALNVDACVFNVSFFFRLWGHWMCQNLLMYLLCWTDATFGSNLFWDTFLFGSGEDIKIKCAVLQKWRKFQDHFEF